MSSQAKTTPRKKPTSTQTKLNISEIDLSQLTLAQLRELKGKVDAELAEPVPPLGKNDVILTYNVSVITSEGVCCENAGMTRMNSILNLRLLADAPMRFENEFQQQVYGPVYAEFYDLIDAANPTSNDLESVRTHVAGGYDVMPGLPSPGLD